MYRNKFAVVLLLILSLLIFGCSDSKPTQVSVKEQLIRYNLGAEPETLDPAKMTGVPEGTLANAMFEGLTRYDSKNMIQPGMAESWSISKDQLVYTFKLRDAKWSNGDSITAEDFKFAWLRVLSPEMASDYAYQLYYIKGAEAYNSGKGKIDDVAIRVIDKHTLEVTLNSPTSQFLGLTAFQTFYPLNKKVVEAHPDWHTSPDFFVSNGPFFLEKWERRQKISLVKNANYWDEKTVKLSKLEFYTIEDNNTAYAMYKTGKLDFIEQPPVQEISKLKNTSDYQVFPESSVYFYSFNVTKKPFDNLKVRKALALTIDRQLISDKITQAGQKPAYAFVPFGCSEADGRDFREAGGNNFFKEDVAEAQKLLAEAGFPGGKGFPEVEILVNNNELHLKIAQVIQQMWKTNLGVNIGIVSREGQVYFKDLQAMNYDIARSGWNPDYLDPMSFIDIFISGGGNNITGWGDVQYDQLVNKANSTGDSIVRFKALHDAENILMSQLPVIPIYFYANDNLIKPNVKNVIVPPFGVSAEFKWAYIK